jgi:branched-chain amino acid transport system permease protein
MIAYLLHVLVLIAIFSVVAMSLNLLVGYLGLLSMAQAGYYGVGAYVAALMALELRTPVLVNLVAGALVAGILAFGIAWCSLRVHDDHFVLVTFGVQIILFSIFKNWISLTRGTAGLGGIPRVNLFGFALDTPWKFLAFTVTLALACFWLVRTLTRAPFGRVLKAILEDEVFAISLGKDIRHYKTIVSSISAMMAAAGGVLYAYYMTFIDPTSFSATESILIISMVIIGGPGSLLGSVLGAAVLITLPEALRFLGIPNTVAAEVRQILLGSSLVALMLLRPQGLVGNYHFRQVR